MSFLRVFFRSSEPLLEKNKLLVSIAKMFVVSDDANVDCLYGASAQPEPAALKQTVPDARIVLTYLCWTSAVSTCWLVTACSGQRQRRQRPRQGVDGTGESV